MWRGWAKAHDDSLIFCSSTAAPPIHFVTYHWGGRARRDWLWLWKPRPEFLNYVYFVEQGHRTLRLVPSASLSVTHGSAAIQASSRSSPPGPATGARPSHRRR